MVAIAACALLLAILPLADALWELGFDDRGAGHDDIKIPRGVLTTACTSEDVIQDTVRTYLEDRHEFTDDTLAHLATNLYEKCVVAGDLGNPEATVYQPVAFTYDATVEVKVDEIPHKISALPGVDASRAYGHRSSEAGTDPERVEAALDLAGRLCLRLRKNSSRSDVRAQPVYEASQPQG